MKYMFVYALLALVAVVAISCASAPCRDENGKIVSCHKDRMDRPGRYDRN